MRNLFRTVAGAIACGLLVPASLAAPGEPLARSKQADLADAVAGVYHGDVISDARGSSQSDVMISVDKVAPGTVRVTSDYERLPEFTVRLTRVMDTIQNADGDEVFLIDSAASPWTLNITVDDASWAGVKH